MSTTNTSPLENWAKVLLKLAGVSLLVAFICISYLLAVGIPKTQARQKYNEASLSYVLSDYAQSLVLAEEAYKIWPENYIYELIQQAKHRLSKDNQKQTL